MHRLEQRQGSVAVQIVCKESHNVRGNANMHYLCRLFTDKGYQAEEGGPVGNTPFMRLSVSRDGQQVKTGEVLDILKKEPEIDVTGIGQEGTGNE